MGFTKMESKLMAHKYHSLEQFDSDVKLMVNDQRAYHVADSDFSKVTYSKTHPIFEG